MGKLLVLLGRPFGKATNLPGEWALKLCPSLFSHFRFTGKVLAVTGSNGKTTTANMMADMLKYLGYRVVNNAKGSNLSSGVATTLLCASRRGVVNADYVVLEVDERYSRFIFRSFAPDCMLVCNLFRDQLTRNGNVDVIVQKLTEAIAPSVKLILNANDPISLTLCPENERVTYQLEKTELSTDSSVNITHDAKVCPRCLHPMRYDYFHYNHIGRFHCPRCGLQTPERADYTAADANLKTGDFAINGLPAHTDYPCLFHLLNCTGAVAALCETGVEPAKAVEALGCVKVNKNRYDEFEVLGRKAVMILSKNQNPVSFDRSIDTLVQMPGQKTVIVYVNNINHTNQKDTTWLYDISFERLKEEGTVLLCTGPRALDLAVRLDLGGFSPEQYLVVPKREALREAVQKTRGTICILTEIYDAKAILEVLKGE